MTAEDWDRLVEQQVGSASARLYGGSQYHRALREFALAVQNMALPEVRLAALRAVSSASLVRARVHCD